MSDIEAGVNLLGLIERPTYLEVASVRTASFLTYLQAIGLLSSSSTSFQKYLDQPLEMDKLSTQWCNEMF